MTAEIAIANRQAIALAADSAVTVGKKRVWNRSNKLFSLGPTNDIAIMIYNVGDLLGIPWEIVVKQFRAERGATRFGRVRDCAESFMDFIKDARFSPDRRSKIGYLAIFLHPIERIQSAIPPKANRTIFISSVDQECDRIVDEANQFPELPNSPSEKAFLKSYKTSINTMAEDLLDRKLPKACLVKICSALYALWKREALSRYFTGVVVAGFGKDQLFSEVIEYAVDGKDDLWIRSWVLRHFDTNDAKTRKTFIMPFGQDDIFHLFMEGISPEYTQFLGLLLERVLSDKSDKLIQAYVPGQDRTTETRLQNTDNRKIAEQFLEEFGTYRNKEVVQPILEVVRALPKEEMAAMAEALVELTSLRRKVDSPIESVGGPVDVAVISKGDGLIWIKRKHYFNVENNKDFLYRKFGGGSHDDGP